MYITAEALAVDALPAAATTTHPPESLSSAPSLCQVGLGQVSSSVRSGSLVILVATFSVGAAAAVVIAIFAAVHPLPSHPVL